MSQHFSPLRYLTLAFLCLGGAVISATTHALPQAPLDITADQLTMTFDKQTAVFEGDVTITQDDMTLTCDTLTLQQNDENALEEVVAKGNVYLRRGTEIASGERATYSPTTNLLILDGNVTLQRGKSTLRGEVLRYNLTDGTVKLQNGINGEPVRARLAPEEMTNTPK